MELWQFKARLEEKLRRERLRIKQYERGSIPYERASARIKTLEDTIAMAKTVEPKRGKLWGIKL